VNWDWTQAYNAYFTVFRNNVGAVEGTQRTNEAVLKAVGSALSLGQYYVAYVSPHKFYGEKVM
jgi:hypothetical protein